VGALTTVEAYAPGTNTWTTVTAMSTPHAWLAAVTGSDGRIYGIGGMWRSAVEAYGPAVALAPTSGKAGSSATLTGTNFGASTAVTVTGPNGKVLGTGRTDGAGKLMGSITLTIPTGAKPGAYKVTAMD